ncbi:MAG: cytochrome-c oxidase [Azoarcus sp.]|nr:cytochrome-c oxidase [Azoarcus sp.]
MHVANSILPTARWLKLAVLYLLAAIALGIAMGASGNFTLRPVHAHVALLGWASLALAGLIYGQYPRAAASRLARAHFWLHNLGLPLMMISLALLLYGITAAGTVLVASEVVFAAGCLAFAFNVFRNLGP